jgi:hypothetical protein
MPLDARFDPLLVIRCNQGYDGGHAENLLRGVAMYGRPFSIHPERFKISMDQHPAAFIVHVSRDGYVIFVV